MSVPQAQTQPPVTSWAAPASYALPQTLNERRLAQLTTTSAFPATYLGPQRTHAQRSSNHQSAQSARGVGNRPFPAPNLPAHWLVAFFPHPVSFSAFAAVFIFVVSLLIHSLHPIMILMITLAAFAFQSATKLPYFGNSMNSI